MTRDSMTCQRRTQPLPPPARALISAAGVLACLMVPTATIAQQSTLGGPGVPGVGLGAGAPSDAGLANQPIPNTLDKMLALALRSNPEVLLAEATLRQAQAELNAARLKVTQEVVMAFHQQRTQEGVLEASERQLQNAIALVKTGQTQSSTVTSAQVEVLKARASIDQLNAQLRYLLGLGGDASLGSLPARGGADMAAGTPDGGSGGQPPLPQPASPRRPDPNAAMEEKLAAKVSLSVTQETLADTLALLTATTEVPFVQGVGLVDALVAIQLQDMPLEQVLLALTDQLAEEELVFVIRDYGILVTRSERAYGLYAPTIPREVPLDPESAERAKQ